MVASLSKRFIKNYGWLILPSVLLVLAVIAITFDNFDYYADHRLTKIITRFDARQWLNLILLPLTVIAFNFIKRNKIAHRLILKLFHNSIFDFKFTKDDDNLIFFPNQDFLLYFEEIVLVVLGIIITVITANLLFHPLHTELLEWQVYVVSSILITLFLLGLGLLFSGGRQFFFKVWQWIALLTTILIVMFVLFLFSNNITKYYQSVIILFLAFLPVINRIACVFKRQTGRFWWLTKLKTISLVIMNPVFIVNLILIFGVVAYFFEPMLINKLRFINILNYIFILTCLGYIGTQYKITLINHFRLKLACSDFLNSIAEKGKWLKYIIYPVIFCFLSGILYLLLFRAAADYRLWLHNAYYAGPALDVINGKSLFYDTPSQYGYLNIHFIAAMERFIGATTNSFNRLNIMLYCLSVLVAGLIFYAITKKKALSVLLAGFFISFLSLFFYEYIQFLYPSFGPLRYGFGILIPLVLLYSTGKKSFFINSLLVSLAIFWSPEEALYIAPAWLFTIVVTTWADFGINWTFLKKSLGKLAFFILLAVSMLLLILIKEYRPGLGIPPIQNILTYTLAYQGGFNSGLLPFYGTYYFYILVCISGLGLVFFLLFNRLKSRLLPLLAFLAIHNIAIFSYFVSRSWFNYIINISGFMLIEIVLILAILNENLGMRQKEFRKFLIMPLIIFLFFYLLISAQNVPLTISYVKNNLSHITKADQPSVPLLKTISNRFHIQTDKIILLSENDTEYLTETQSTNLLPLNPAAMTFDLAGWQKKYLDSQIKKIPRGTIIIDDLGFPVQIKPVYENLRLIRQEIEKRYKLRFLGEMKNKMEIFEVTEIKTR